VIIVTVVYFQTMETLSCCYRSWVCAPSNALLISKKLVLAKGSDALKLGR